MRIRVGLVGLGNDWEVRHRPALRALSDRFEVRAVCEQVALRAEQAAREFNATAVEGYRALARREDVDAVLILAPQWCGPLPIAAACDAGKAIYCAAGMDFDPEQACWIKQQIEQSGVSFMAAFPRRHAPATTRLKELIATRLGPPRLVFCHRRMPAEESSGAHLHLVRRAAMHELVELVDWCAYVIGRPATSVIGMRHRPDAPHEHADDDYQAMNLQFAAPTAAQVSAMAQISCGRYMPATWPEAMSFRPPAALQVACTDGIAFIDLPTTLVWFDKAGRHIESLESERPVGELLLGHFFRSVTSLVRNTHDLEEAYRALTVVLKAQQSEEEGRRIDLTCE
jgi:predicted dehydrogenase